MTGTGELRKELETFHTLRKAFNPFIVLNNPGQEETHNRMLAWLLDPEGSHSLKGFFAQKLLQCQRPLPDFSSLKVEREVIVKGPGRRAERRIDLLATLPEQEVGWLIELKTYSGERPGQLNDYRTWFEARFGNYTRHHVYLTRYAERATDDHWRAADDHWRAVDYQTIIDILLSRPPSEPAVDAFISGYVDALQRWFTLGAQSQNQGRVILDALDQRLEEFPPELRATFADEYQSLKRLLKRIEELENLNGTRAA